MSKADTQKMLSEAGIDASKVSVLDKGEMKKTEGEWFWFVPLLISVGAGIAGGYGAYTIHNRDNEPLPTHANGVTFTYQL